MNNKCVKKARIKKKEMEKTDEISECGCTITLIQSNQSQANYVMPTVI